MDMSGPIQFSDFLSDCTQLQDYMFFGDIEIELFA